jgi:hypothetical protein
MKTLGRVMPVLLALAFLVSCGAERQDGVVEAGSLDEALALAADAKSFVVIEFWMPG